eukprot:TRINITY_DN1919_c0_g1_i1.p2 TRINITY_DN1919_c0_g1~~TRINITY_DN1919_c0_g1_i1.p2  ORF type:complete len:124 (-),score=50.02 TRINITY_DN1919_c0_g1_i1:288-659(-)
MERGRRTQRLRSQSNKKGDDQKRKRKEEEEEDKENQGSEVEDGKEEENEEENEEEDEETKTLMKNVNVYLSSKVDIKSTDFPVDSPSIQALLGLARYDWSKPQAKKAALLLAPSFNIRKLKKR